MRRLYRFESIPVGDGSEVIFQAPRGGALSHMTLVARPHPMGRAPFYPRNRMVPSASAPRLAGSVRERAAAIRQRIRAPSSAAHRR